MQESWEPSVDGWCGERSDEVWDEKMVYSRQEQGTTLIRGSLWAVILLIMMEIIHTYMRNFHDFLNDVLNMLPKNNTSKPCVGKNFLVS
jgi:hypothetical protein